MDKPKQYKSHCLRDRLASKRNSILTPGFLIKLLRDLSTESGPTSCSFDFEMDVSPLVTATTTILTSDPNPSVYGQPVTFTASVTPSTSGQTAPTGTVTFMDGSTAIGTGTLNASDIATFSTSALAIGTHSITAVYGGDSNFSGSTSSPVPQAILSLDVTASFGSGQNATVNTAFANPLVVHRHGPKRQSRAQRLRHLHRSYERRQHQQHQHHRQHQQQRPAGRDVHGEHDRGGPLHRDRLRGWRQYLAHLQPDQHSRDGGQHCRDFRQRPAPSSTPPLPTRWSWPSRTSTAIRCPPPPSPSPLL